MAEQERIDQATGRIDELRHLMVLRAASGPASASVEQAHAGMMRRYFGRAAELLREVQDAGRTDGRYGMTPAGFAARYVPEMDAIIALRDAQLTEAEQHSIAARERSRDSLAWLGGLTTLLMALVLVMLLTIRQRVVQPLMQASAALHAMERGDLGAPLPEPRSNDEIAAVMGGIEALRRQSRVRREGRNRTWWAGQAA